MAENPWPVYIKTLEGQNKILKERWDRLRKESDERATKLKAESTAFTTTAKDFYERTREQRSEAVRILKWTLSLLNDESLTDDAFEQLIEHGVQGALNRLEVSIAQEDFRAEETGWTKAIRQKENR